MEKFRLSYRDKVSDILENAYTFEHYKMLTRSMHPQCALTFKEWVTGTRGFLVRLEEVGIFAQGLREWQDRCQLTFEVISFDQKTRDAAQVGVKTTANIEVYGIYEHFALRDKHDSSDFAFV